MAIIFELLEAFRRAIVPGLYVTLSAMRFCWLSNETQGAIDQAVTVSTPEQTHTQSGLGLISGWACVADKVEISIDGGVPVKISGEMERLDVKHVCGQITAGFGKLID